MSMLCRRDWNFLATNREKIDEQVRTLSIDSANWHLHQWNYCHDVSSLFSSTYRRSESRITYWLAWRKLIRHAWTLENWFSIGWGINWISSDKYRRMKILWLIRLRRVALTTLISSEFGNIKWISKLC